ncbi:Zinc/iron permease [Myriangium duriaei CBS 260.36]|uniref:Zinc/iron permease n=1 Tax=Myriangium duriaei CBS 260.36 TaxID=1168546 RepID=A0A9P4J1H4_9PEZI|nr:Zinc/iron permease [Myriangium duriaei CBS 260.36]
MTVISGVACVLGASVICADIIVCKFPGMKGFRIQDSDAFLSSSLSLSFGVMLFSATYKMLPSAKTSLQEGGFSPKVAAWVLIICFVGGALVIQVASQILHHYIPSHVVNCEHSHDENHENSKDQDRNRSSSHASKRVRFSRHKSQSLSDRWPTAGPESDDQSSYFTDAPDQSYPPTRETEREDTFKTALTRRPSIPNRVKTTLSKLSFAPGDDCECDSTCHGFTETCGQECFKIVQTRGSLNGNATKAVPSTRRAGLGGLSLGMRHTESTPLLGDIRESRSSDDILHPTTSAISDSHIDDVGPKSTADTSALTPYDHAVMHRHKSSHDSGTEDSEDHSHQHHHHVPNNAFLSIGLQTSLAIALHKLPEGFITYATNHANPRLGFSVFLALFIHNITEGFALALPLYLALQSRWKAMIWAFLLGGCSQPLGAGIAALWFKIAGNTDMAPGERVYGGMFAVTSGIMTSVALSLFGESLDLTHNRNLCMMFAFIGMGIMGISSALTA